jgi:hypothetical protein
VEILEDAVPDFADSKPREPEAERLTYLAPPHPNQRVLDPDRIPEPNLDSCEMGHALVGLCWGFGDQRPVDCAAGRSAGTTLDFRSSLFQILTAWDGRELDKLLLAQMRSKNSAAFRRARPGLAGIRPTQQLSFPKPEIPT